MYTYVYLRRCWMRLNYYVWQWAKQKIFKFGKNALRAYIYNCVGILIWVWGYKHMAFTTWASARVRHRSVVTFKNGKFFVDWWWPFFLQADERRRQARKQFWQCVIRFSLSMRDRQRWRHVLGAMLLIFRLIVFLGVFLYTFSYNSVLLICVELTYSTWKDVGTS